MTDLEIVRRYVEILPTMHAQREVSAALDRLAVELNLLRDTKANLLAKLAERGDELAALRSHHNRVKGILSETYAVLEKAKQSTAASSRRCPRGVLKETVIRLLSETPNGLTTNEIIAKAKNQGTPLQRGSVSSLLSKLKVDGVLVPRGDRYRFARMAEQE